MSIFIYLYKSKVRDGHFKTIRMIRRMKPVYESKVLPALRGYNRLLKTIYDKKGEKINVR